MRKDKSQQRRQDVLVRGHVILQQKLVYLFYLFMVHLTTLPVALAIQCRTVC